MEGLTEGRMVHYVANSKHYAAVVTHLWSDGIVNLYVFPDGSYPLDNYAPTSVQFDDQVKGNSTWHWIEKV